MHVGDHGALGLESLDPGQRIVDAEMAGMAGITQPVYDPELEIFKAGPALAGDIADIGRIGGVADAIAQRRDVTVLDVERRERHRTALPCNGAALAGFDRMTIEDRWIVAAFGRDE